MKIAIPSKNSMVDDHFGHCEYYTIVDVDENKNITKTETIESPKGCGCKTEIAGTLRQMGVELMLAGNMGQGAANKISATGMKIIRGCSGEIKKVVENYLTGYVLDSGLICDHNHNDGHSCSHT